MTVGPSSHGAVAGDAQAGERAVQRPEHKKGYVREGAAEHAAAHDVAGAELRLASAACNF